MSDIFVSYASQDRPRVKPLVDALEQQGWTVWWDRTIAAGQRWDHVIQAALTDARCVIVVWTRISVESEWVINEAADARRRGILIPVLLDDVEMPLEFKRLQTANLVDWSGDLSTPQFADLARAVTQFVAKDHPAPIHKSETSKPPGPTRTGVSWFARLWAHQNIAAAAVFVLSGIAGYALCYIAHWDLLWTSTVRTTAGCVDGGMIGKQTPLPEGGDSLENARVMSTGLYISTRVLPGGTQKYFKILLKESEKLWINVRRPQQGGFAEVSIYNADRTNLDNGNTYDKPSVSWLPPKPGWLYFSIGSDQVNVADAVYGVCITNK